MVAKGRSAGQRAWKALLRYRNWILLVSTIALNSGFAQNVTKGIPCLALNCHACPFAVTACPVGVVQHSVGLGTVPWYVLGVVGLAGSLGGRAACGWLCPFGWIQELVHKLPVPKWAVSPRSRAAWPTIALVTVVYLCTGGLLWTRLLQVPLLLAGYLLCGLVVYGFLGLSRSFVLLGMVLTVPFLTAETWFCKLCPAGALEGSIPWILIDETLRPLVGTLFWLKMGLLLALLVWMAVTRRPFCRWVCPLGAFWSPLNRVSTLHLGIDTDLCTRCDRCRQVCPVDIGIYNDAGAPACIRCLKCVDACPVSCVSVRMR